MTDSSVHQGKEKKSIWLLSLAFVTCPCHFPIYGVLLGGTVLGGYMTEYQGTTIALMSALFLLSLFSGMKMRRTAVGEK